MTVLSKLTENVSPLTLAASAAVATATLLFARSFVVSLDGIPGPFPWPIFGQFFDILPYNSTNTFYKYFMERYKKYGPIYRIMLFNQKYVVVSDPEEIKRILSTPSDFVRNDQFQIACTGICPNALFVIYGDLWKTHRKLLQPAFGQQQLRLTARVAKESVDEAAKIIRQRISQSSDKTSTVIDVYDMFHFMALDVIGKIAFSHQFGALQALYSDGESEDIKKFGILVGVMMGRFFVPKSAWSLFHLHEQEPKILEASTYLRSIINKLIAERRAAKDTAKKSGKIVDTKNRWEMDVLDRLLDQDDAGKDRFTEEEIVDELVGFFLAGHETTANTLTLIIHDICQNPNVMKRLVDEIDQVNTRLGGNITTENIHEFKYLEWVMKETQRLHSVVSFTERKPAKDVEILGHHVAANTPININFESMHLNEKYWKDPETFKPDRWAEPVVPGTFLPFGDGSHVCIGQKMASIETRIIIIQFLLLFRIELVPGQEFKKVMTITSGFKSGVKIRVTERASA